MPASSFDSNLLVYAHNEAAPEHAKAKSFVERILSNSTEEIVITHQTLFELFAVLTSAAVFSTPITPMEAWQTCDFYLTHSAVEIASYEPPILSIVRDLLVERPQRGRRFFDLVLAATLRFHGVKILYTRNARHFQGYSFLKAVNPL